MLVMLLMFILSFKTEIWSAILKKYLPPPPLTHPPHPPLAHPYPSPTPTPSSQHTPKPTDDVTTTRYANSQSEARI